MEKCYVCGKKSELKHLGRGICRKCFLRNIEKRVKKHLGRRPFKKNDRVLVVGGLERELLKRAVGGMPLKISFRKKLPKKISNFDWIVAGKTMDEVNEEFLLGLFKGKIDVKIKKKVFNVLEPLTDEEALQYAKLRGTKFSVERGKGFLDAFKELSYNLYKNIRELKDL